MGCCKTLLTKVEKPEDAVTLLYVTGKKFVLHRDDIVAYSASDVDMSLSLTVGWTKSVQRSELLNFDEVVERLGRK